MRYYLNPDNQIIDRWADRPIGNVLEADGGWYWLFNDEYATTRSADATNCGRGFADRLTAFEAAYTAI